MNQFLLENYVTTCSCVHNYIIYIVIDLCNLISLIIIISIFIQLQLNNAQVVDEVLVFICHEYNTTVI
jgi:hypothetical protein